VREREKEKLGKKNPRQMVAKGKSLKGSRLLEVLYEKRFFLSKEKALTKMQAPNQNQ
jgi:hypothetical protein